MLRFSRNTRRHALNTLPLIKSWNLAKLAERQDFVLSALVPDFNSRAIWGIEWLTKQIVKFSIESETLQLFPVPEIGLLIDISMDGGRYFYVSDMQNGPVHVVDNSLTPVRNIPISELLGKSVGTTDGIIICTSLIDRYNIARYSSDGKKLWGWRQPIEIDSLAVGPISKLRQPIHRYLVWHEQQTYVVTETNKITVDRLDENGTHQGTTTLFSVNNIPVIGEHLDGTKLEMWPRYLMDATASSSSEVILILYNHVISAGGGKLALLTYQWGRQPLAYNLPVHLSRVVAYGQNELIGFSNLKNTAHLHLLSTHF